MQSDECVGFIYLYVQNICNLYTAAEPPPRYVHELFTIVCTNGKKQKVAD